MKVITQGLITAAATADVTDWLNLTRAATWAGSADVRRTFPNARNPSGNDWEFPMPRSTVQIDAMIAFRTGTVLVTRVA